jgi:zinc D-Ala-D-Ala dipeptidase
VDAHLVDENLKVLDFASPFDLLDPRGAAMDADGLSETAWGNRELLRRAMGGAGFTNYPSEWWHWSYGDQGWAYRGGHFRALYGAIAPPGLAGEEPEFRIKEQPGWDR